MKLHSALGIAILFIGLCVLGSFLQKETTTTTSEWQREIISQSPPSSINPEVETYQRCFRRFETNKAFERYIRWLYEGKRIVFIEAANDGILWRRGDTIEAWIYPK